MADENLPLVAVKPVFHMITSVFSNNVQAIGMTIWQKYPDDWDDLYSLDRIEFYSDDGNDCVKFEAIVRTHCQTTEMIRTIEGYPRNLPLKSAIVFCLFAKHGQKFLFRGEPRNIAEDHAPPVFEAIEMIIMETKLVNYLVIFLMNNKTKIKFGF